MFSLLNLLAGAGTGLGPSFDPLLSLGEVAFVGPVLGFGGGSLEPIEVVLELEAETVRRGALDGVASVFDRELSTPGLDISSLLFLVGRGDLAGLGDLVAVVLGLEMAGLTVLVLKTGCLAG